MLEMTHSEQPTSSLAFQRSNNNECKKHSSSSAISSVTYSSDELLCGLNETEVRLVCDAESVYSV